MTLGALSGLRILDVAGNFGNYAGKLFANLGADVVLIEPPGGSKTRGEAPFSNETSLRFEYENTSKKSVLLDLTEANGRELFRRLVASSDAVIESFPARHLEKIGLGLEELLKEQPSLVLTRITPFGQSGPFSQYQADDLVAMALGGMLYLAGYPDDTPVVAAGQQAVHAGQLFAAVGTMIALTHAEFTGEGQEVDVSLQESVTLGMENAAQFYDSERMLRKRYAGDQRQAGAGVFQAEDGYVYLLAGGVGATRFWHNTVEWLRQEAVTGSEQLSHGNWLNIEFLRTQEAKSIFKTVFESFSRTRTKESLYRDAQRRRVPLCPVNTMRDIPDNRQLRHRDFFVSVPSSAQEGERMMPGAPYKLSETPWRVSRAPRLGEHNDEILTEISGNGARRIAV